MTNFARTLESSQATLAQHTLKDPYVFDFLTIDAQHERSAEQQLIEHIQRFLLELGAGFAFVGRQGTSTDSRGARSRIKRRAGHAGRRDG
ncbi:MAG TPA: PDDEXK nuclease domain-containing protein [Gemmatimonadaceae bacterium]|nr:PDDEXK nuclease domain-containing protein [Gemmatimonadaceae bacterium]